MAPVPHPLSGLSVDESNRARDIILATHKGVVLDFRTIFLVEAPKAEVVAFLELENAGKVTPDTPRPARLAEVKYDVIGGSKTPEYHESIVNLTTGERVDDQILDDGKHASLTM